MSTRTTSYMPAPTGTVTFAFTDIEGSTVRWDRHPQAMQAAVRRHDEIVEAAVRDHHGYVFKTLGDAFCCAFTRPHDAVAAMLLAQRRMAAEDFEAVDGLRIRIAIHTGTADERGGDYFGPTLNRVARLLSIAHGGQLLVSQITRTLVDGLLPPQTFLRDLGEHRLKDLTYPEHVYQLIAPDLPATFPPLRSVDVQANNIPLARTSFVGREIEIAEITALLGSHRLVTLVGSGGVGKTRTALQVAANHVGGPRDGVWFIELAPLTSGDYVASTIAAAMGLTLGADDPVRELVQALAAKEALLVIDNCEHVVVAAARTIAALLSGCPGILVLATTRQALRVQGEVTFRMPSLPVAASSPALRPDDALASAAIALFVDRARSYDQRFTLTDDNVDAVADICRRLDGIALAIELVAARVKTFSPRQLQERLHERFRLLSGGSRDLVPRQQTMRALIDWSYNLLDERERALFSQLSIFAGSFSLEAATAIGAGPALDEYDVIDVLSQLVDKSLVAVETSAGEMRYRLLESMKAYGREKCEAARIAADCAAAHLRYFGERFARARAEFNASDNDAPIDALFLAELEDVRAALDRSFAIDAVDAGARLYCAIGSRWRNRGLVLEAIVRAKALLDSQRITDTALLAQVWDQLAGAHSYAGQMREADASSQHALELARLSGDRDTLAQVLMERAGILVHEQRAAQALVLIEEADGIAAPANLVLRTNLLVRRMEIAAELGDPAEATRRFEELYGAVVRAGSMLFARTIVTVFSEIELRFGRPQAALDRLLPILPELAAESNRSDWYEALVAAANASLGLGRLDDAAARLRQVLDSRTDPTLAARDLGTAIGLCAVLAQRRSEERRAATLLAFVELHGDAWAIRKAHRTLFAQAAVDIDRALGTADARERREHGVTLSLDAAVALATSLIAGPAGVTGA